MNSLSSDPLLALRLSSSTVSAVKPLFQNTKCSPSPSPHSSALVHRHVEWTCSVISRGERDVISGFMKLSAGPSCDCKYLYIYIHVAMQTVCVNHAAVL